MRRCRGWAPAAIQAGHRVGRNIAALVEGRPTTPFRYRDKGSLATIGRAKAVGQIGRLQFSGFFAWWVWWIVHIAYLIGFRNRIAVMMGWAWQYFAFARGARLITGRAWEPGRQPDPQPHPPQPTPPSPVAR